MRAGANGQHPPVAAAHAGAVLAAMMLVVVAAVMVEGAVVVTGRHTAEAYTVNTSKSKRRHSLRQWHLAC